MKHPAISVIIPFFNVREKYFDDCYASIMRQTFSDFEVIIVDDGSEEKYGKYLEDKIDSDQKVRIYHTDNQGVSEARNYGVAQSKGETICFVDADDYVVEWMLEDLWEAYTSNEVEAAASYYQMVNDESFVFHRSSEKIEIVDNNYLKRTALIGMNCNPEPYGYLSAGPVAVLFNTYMAKDILFPKGIKYMEDVIWNYQYFTRCKSVAVVKECVYAYRQNEESATHTYKLDMINDRISALSIIHKLCGENNEWYALRVLANYSICCKCCMLTNEISGVLKKVSKVREMNKDPVWRAFKTGGISKYWDKKYRIKRLMANSGLMPFFYYIHK